MEAESNQRTDVKACLLPVRVCVKLTRQCRAYVTESTKLCSVPIAASSSIEIISC